MIQGFEVTATLFCIMKLREIQNRAAHPVHYHINLPAGITVNLKPAEKISKDAGQPMMN
jgi:hypothetical protein